MYRQRTTSRAWLFLTALGASLWASCTAARPLRPDEPLALHEQEGLLALAVDSDCRLSVSVCADGDFSSCSDIGPLDRDGPLAVQVLPAGRWCVMQILCELAGSQGVLEDLKTREQAQCVDVKPGRISYPGHLVYETSATQVAIQLVNSRWDRRADVLRVLVKKRWPSLQGKDIDVAPVINGAGAKASGWE